MQNVNGLGDYTIKITGQKVSEKLTNTINLNKLEPKIPDFPEKANRVDSNIDQIRQTEN